MLDLNHIQGVFITRKGESVWRLSGSGAEKLTEDAIRDALEKTVGKIPGFTFWARNHDPDPKYQPWVLILPSGRFGWAKKPRLEATRAFLAGLEVSIQG